LVSVLLGLFGSLLLQDLFRRIHPCFVSSVSFPLLVFPASSSLRSLRIDSLGRLFGASSSVRCLAGEDGGEAGGPGAGGLEGGGGAEDGGFGAALADDLQAYGQSVASEAARDRNGRQAEDGDHV